MDRVVTALLTNRDGDHETLYADTDLAVARFADLDDETREDFRTALRDYLRTYAFLAHVLPYTSTDMERLYLYGKILAARLPREDDDETPDLSDAAVLTHLRMEKGDLTVASLTSVTDEQAEITGHTGEGKGKAHEQPTEKLSSIIEVLNDRFGLNLTEADQLFFDQISTEVADNDRAQAVALNNDFDQFNTVFDGILEGVILDRQTANDALLAAFLDKPDFREALTTMIGRRFYNNVRDRAVGE